MFCGKVEIVTICVKILLQNCVDRRSSQDAEFFFPRTFVALATCIDNYNYTYNNSNNNNDDNLKKNFNHLKQCVHSLLYFLYDVTLAVSCINKRDTRS